MDKKRYYISVAEGSISQIQTASPYSFVIEATDDEIIRLREIFDGAYVEDVRSFVRAHIPFMEYHHDRPNDKFDEDLQQAYAMIYQLGDDEAKRTITEMGILPHKND